MMKCDPRAYAKCPTHKYCGGCAAEAEFMEGSECDKFNKSVLSKPMEPKIDPADDYFGAVLNCAVRYAVGRKTYMPSLVIDFITPLLPELSDKTLQCFDQDVTDAKWTSGYGDPGIDEPEWLRFHEAVRAERTKRGHTLYKSWRENP